MSMNIRNKAKLEIVPREEDDMRKFMQVNNLKQLDVEFGAPEPEMVDDEQNEAELEAFRQRIAKNKKRQLTMMAAKLKVSKDDLANAQVPNVRLLSAQKNTLNSVKTREQGPAIVDEKPEAGHLIKAMGSLKNTEAPTRDLLVEEKPHQKDIRKVMGTLKKTDVEERELQEDKPNVFHLSKAMKTLKKNDMTKESDLMFEEKPNAGILSRKMNTLKKNSQVKESDLLFEDKPNAGVLSRKMNTLKKNSQIKESDLIYEDKPNAGLLSKGMKTLRKNDKIKESDMLFEAKPNERLLNKGKEGLKETEIPERPVYEVVEAVEDESKPTKSQLLRKMEGLKQAETIERQGVDEKPSGSTLFKGKANLTKIDLEERQIQEEKPNVYHLNKAKKDLNQVELEERRLQEEKPNVFHLNKAKKDLNQVELEERQIQEEKPNVFHLNKAKKGLNQTEAPERGLPAEEKPTVSTLFKKMRTLKKNDNIKESDMLYEEKPNAGLLSKGKDALKRASESRTNEVIEEEDENRPKEEWEEVEPRLREPFWESHEYVHGDYHRGYALRGWRDDMEDACDVVSSLGNAKVPNLFAVYDGHGGEECADFCRKYLLTKIANHQDLSRDPKSAIADAFLTVDDSFGTIAWKQNMMSGTTATVVYVQAIDVQAQQESANRSNGKFHQATSENPRFAKSAENESSRDIQKTLLARKKMAEDASNHTAYKFHCASVGDSRAVIVYENGRVVPLSIDHNLKRKDEMERIRAANGEIRFDPEFDDLLVYSVEVERGLNVTRSIGDKDFKPLVSAYPEQKEGFLTDNAAFIILGTDGLWCNVRNEEVGLMVLNYGLDAGLKNLADLSNARGCFDNCTLVGIDVQKMIRSMENLQN